MRVSDHRYTRDLRRYNLALRLIGHEARTQTICVWTGFSDERVRKLYRSFFRGYDPRAASLRHRGPSPRRLATFLRSPVMRSEAAAVAGLCQLHGVIPAKPLANARRELPSVPCGERLCYAFELYRAIVPQAQLNIEQLILLVTILAQGEELETGHCAECGGAVLVDKLGASRRLCTHCRHATSHSSVATEAPRHAPDSSDGSQGSLF
jgi:hypothetical protein